MQDVAVIADPVLDEKIHRRVFSSGLTAYVVRKKGFSKSYATIATRYGSIDTALPKPARNEGLPDGVAHFLEHKVFSTPDGDTFDRFAAQGASANAFTTFSSTSYLFGTSTNYTANLRTLLEMVFSLYVTDDNVEKEKGIIGQEIAMYDDDPDWRIYFGALQALYHKHPVAIDIAGTSKTISGITPELLQRIHRAYYHPRIMAFAAVSPEPVERTFREIERAVEGRSYGRAPGRRRVDVDEPASVRKASVRLKLPVARPRLIAAFKDTPAGYGRRRLKRELAAAVAIDCLFGSAGTVFLGLYEDSLVDEHFSCSYTGDETYSFAMIGGETDDVRRLQRELGRRLEEARAAGVSRDDFERVRNKEIGSYARAFNAPERIAQMLVSHHLRGTTLTDYRELLVGLKLAEVNRCLRELFDPSRRAYSIVLPK